MIGVILALLLHPVHATQAEAQWNTKTQRLEVSLKLQHIDVQRILAREPSAKGAKLSEAESMLRLQKYLEKHFRLESKETDAGKLHWVGSETEGASLWVFFELSPPAGQPWLLRNSVLLEFESDHTNVVSFLGEKRKSILFVRNKFLHPLPADILSAVR
jgi:hypothetical protein